ncbi:MAG TPA: ABC transporter permease [Streptosporangiaceae bacterium]|nr:ABC transporter permease [Streptosporangiaceae bacterium]
MFFTYLRRELRRRRRQALVVSLGLAVGIGLVITVTAASAGVSNAQGTVLHSLYGVGTDMTVSQAPSQGTAGAFGFRVRRGTGTRPAAGSKIDLYRLAAAGSLGTLDSSSVTTVAALHNVAAAAGSLTLNNTHITGTVPNFSAGGGGGFGGGGGSGASTGTGSITPTTFTVNGVDLSASGQALGPLTSGKISSGRTFTSADSGAKVAVVDAGYAKSEGLKVGSVVTLGNTSGAGNNFDVVGIVTEPPGATPADVFVPLQQAQSLSGTTGKVNTIYVAASSSSAISGVSGEIKKALPSATVTTSSDLANEVTGSISSAASLANNLGKWLAIAVLAAAFLLASLLTMSAVSRRTREFGTLKALGWRSRRVIGQVMGEAVACGIAGGVMGVLLGLGGAELVSKFAPSLTASVGLTSGSATPGGARQFGAGGGGFGGSGGGGGGGGFGGFRRATAAASHSVAVHLNAPVTFDAIALAVVLAVAGGLIAGTFGGWRAARLRPAAALSRVE